MDAPALDLLRRATRTPSVTGDELAFARLVAAELEDVDAGDVRLVEVEPCRAAVWSRRRDSGGGSLLLAGNLDTVRTDGWRERWQGTKREDPFAAAIVDGAVRGRGAADDSPRKAIRGRRDRLDDHGTPLT